jgi:hypothetical protein
LTPFLPFLPFQLLDAYEQNKPFKSVDTPTHHKNIQEVDTVNSSKGGYINKCKVSNHSCKVEVDEQDKALANDIAENGDPWGIKTEELVNKTFKPPHYEMLEGGKYNGEVNGFDHVMLMKDSDGNVISTVIIDSKQIAKNGSISLSSQGAGGTTQGSRNWMNEVYSRLDPDTPAAQAVKTAIRENNLTMAVAGVKKNNTAGLPDVEAGELIFVKVHVPNKGG